MADGGQRLLDVIDDPNALESFLGGLTSDSELLPSAETVDNVVASLARSLDENEYEVDSPNETLFDTLDSSSNHLTDISRSYVPSDFGHVAVQNDAFTNNLDGFSNGNNVMRGIQQHHDQQTHSLDTSGCDQFLASTNSSISLMNSVISAASSNNNSTHVTASTLKQITPSVSNCDPSKSTNFVQSGQIPLTQNAVSSASNSLNFNFSQDLHQHNKHNIQQLPVPQNQVTSLSSVSADNQLQQNVPSNATNNLISAVGSGNQNGVVSTLTDTTSNFHVVANQQQQQPGQKVQQNILVSTSINSSANIQVTSGGATSIVTNASANNETNIANNNITLSTSTNVVGSTTAALQQAQQFLANTSNTATVNQLVAGQTVSIPSMTVSAPQLIANAQGGLVAASAGQNLLQQIQSASASQSYIAMEQPTALIATGPTGFGTNVALLSTGGTQYAVLPTTPQFLTNAIIPQSHTIQTLTKTANGAYFQTTGTPQIVTSSVNALQNVSVANATSDAYSSTIVKPKQPPQLLPKPLSQVSSAGTTTNTSTVTTMPNSSVTVSVDSANSGNNAQQGGASTPVGSTAVTDSVVTQLIQQSQQQGNTGTVAITPQGQTYAIGNTAGLGQVVVSQVNNLSTMTSPQQAQLAGTIVVNQYGQPMLLPTASTAQAGAGIQLILRQQPAQQQVLTIQTPQGPATINAQGQAQQGAGKNIVRYVSQVPQLAQNSGYGLQQIQTANGPAYIAVRYPSNQIAVSQASQFSQIQTESIVNATAAMQNQSAQLQQQAGHQQSVQIQFQQQQTQQLMQQTSQQQQIQLQGGMSQAHLQAQQQLQVQSGAQLQQQLQAQQQQQQQQQQLSLQAQSQQHLQQATQQGQQMNAQNYQQQGQVQQLQHSMPMETQTSMSNQNSQNHFINQNQTSHTSLQSSNQAQLSRDAEQQQISVPDSSSEPPPPKKAKTKSKSSKKKVTLDLEQLLKQSGIMDEDLNDDMSFDFGFAMDTPSNGLPASPQAPPAQIPVINTTETPKKSSKKKSNAKKTPAQPPPPPPPIVPPPPVVIASPSAKPKKKSSPKKKNTPLPPPVTPPPPLVNPQPPPPPIVTTPKSSKSKSSKKKSSGSVNENQKSEITTPTPPIPTPAPTTPKTGSSKKNAPPKTFSSLDTLMETINFVAASAGAASAAAASSPSFVPPTPTPPPPPPPTTTPSTKPSPSPKSKSKSKKKIIVVPPPAPTPSNSEMLNLPPPPPVYNAPTSAPPPPLPTNLPSSIPPLSIPNSTFSQSQAASATFSTAPNLSAATTLTPSLSSVTPTPRVTGPNMTNGSTSVSTSQTGLTRVVQTIQLTPQNQQLLRNIQSQIQRLCALPKRTEQEQAGLQKLVVLQQQVIATGIPVPNPAHLNNLAQSVNVESINLATPCTSVPSDTATASSTNFPLVSPSCAESDLNLNPVSSTSVTSAALSVLASINSSNSSSKLNNSSKHVNVSNNSSSSPQIPTTVNATASNNAAAGGSSNNAAAFVVGSPSVSSTASPDSTSNLTNNLTVEQSTTPLPSSNVVANTTAALPPPPPNTSTANLTNSVAGVGSVVVSNVKADLGQLVASVSVASSEEKLKDNTHGKSSQGVTMAMASAPTVPVSTPVTSSTNSAPFSQHLPPVPLSGSYVPSTFSAARSAIDEKKAEEQRLANLKAEEEKRARWKKEEFEMLLQRDQQYVVKPDYEVPFESKKDAAERLMKYHIYRDRNDMNFEDFDAEFGNNAGLLLNKFSVMMSKYRNLLLKESMKEVGCAERVMLERMFVSEEKVRLEQDRLMVAQGDSLELPPPPEEWVPKIKEMVDKEMLEFEPQDPVVSQQVQSAIDSIMACESEDTNNYLLEEGDKIEYDAFGVPINSSGYAGLGTASSADIDEAVRSILS